MTVYLGRDSLEGPNPNMVTRNVSRTILHPDYDRSFHDDIALLQLSSNVTFTDYVRPVCLAASGSRFDGTEGWVTGFGRTSTHSRTRVTHFYILTDKLSQNVLNFAIVSSRGPQHMCKDSEQFGWYVVLFLKSTTFRFIFVVNVAPR